MGLLELILPIAIAAAPFQARAEPSLCSDPSFVIHIIVAQAIKGHLDCSSWGQKLRDKAFEKYRTSAKGNRDDNPFHHEPSIFLVYRSLDQVDLCEDDKFVKKVSEVQNNVREFCHKRNNNVLDQEVIEPDVSKIYASGLTLDTSCYPTENINNVFRRYMVDDALNVGPKRICQATMRGLKEAWTTIESCKHENQWFDLDQWSNGTLKSYDHP